MTHPTTDEQYPLKCRIVKHPGQIVHCDCESPDPIDLGISGKELEDYFASGVWHDKQCPNFGRDVFDQTIELEFEHHVGVKLVIKKHEWIV